MIILAKGIFNAISRFAGQSPSAQRSLLFIYHWFLELIDRPEAKRFSGPLSTERTRVDPANPVRLLAANDETTREHAKAAKAKKGRPRSTRTPDTVVAISRAR